MGWIRLQQLIILICEPLDFSGKLLVKTPKLPRSAVPHNSVVRPARRSSSASSANASSRPAFTSSSIWRSQASASNSTNQARNFANSSGAKPATALSISWRVIIFLHYIMRGIFPHEPRQTNYGYVVRRSRTYSSSTLSFALAIICCWTFGGTTS
jgi:hypothetical protein